MASPRPPSQPSMQEQAPAVDTVLAVATMGAFDHHAALSLDLRHGCLVLAVVGRLSSGVPESFVSEVMDHARSSGTRRVVIDFRECEQISSSTLGFLVRFFRQAASREAQVVAVGVNRQVRVMLEILGIDSFLLLVDDWPTALTFFAAQGI